MNFEVSDTTLRTRRDEWIAAGVFDQLEIEARAGYDRILELDLDVVAIDGSLHKAPYGGEGTGKSPVDRAKLGWKWSVAAERSGIPIGWSIDGANRNDVVMLEPTLDAIANNGLLADIGMLSLDRSYDYAKIRHQLHGRGLDDLDLYFQWFAERSGERLGVLECEPRRTHSHLRKLNVRDHQNRSRLICPRSSPGRGLRLVCTCR